MSTAAPQELQSTSQETPSINRQLPTLRECISALAQPQTARLNELQGATSQAPEAEHYRLQDNSVTVQNINGQQYLSFAEIPGLAFAPDKLLMAGLASIDQRNLRYPHTNPQGEVVSASLFEVSPEQAYVIQRRAKELLAQKGDLQKLGPEKTVSTAHATYAVDQSGDGRVQVLDPKTRTPLWRAENAALNVPQEGNNPIDVYFQPDNQNYAAYVPELQGFVIGKTFLEHLKHPETSSSGLSSEDRAKVVARHEFNHSIWDGQNSQSRKEIMDFFPNTAPAFRQFAASLITDPGYLQSAIEDVQKNPTAETIEMHIGGKAVKIGKERVVNELLAYGTWSEIITRDQVTRFRQEPGTAGPHGLNGQKVELTFKSAADCLALLTPPARKELEKSGLSMKKDDPRFQNFFKSFKTAIDLF